MLAQYATAQNTVGTLTISSGVADGYTLFSAYKKTYLINNCGQVINEWISEYPPGNAVYLLENGSILRAGRVSDTRNFTFGGVGGVIEIFDWDGNLTWQYQYNDENYIQHHDVFPMPNGNVLILAAVKLTNQQALDAGRDPSKLVDNELYNEQILEVTPNGLNGADVVWEWNIIDHVVQDFDNTKDNFGNVADNPFKLDINFLNGRNGVANWLHINSIQYNEKLDQIVLSSRNLSELWIIDHSTTTAEAATSSGGTHGKGGDFLYRWGNPQSYDRGTELDRKLYGQHYPYIIPEGLENEGKIILFNNGINRDPEFSEVFIVNPPLKSLGVYELNNPDAFGPLQPDYIYSGTSTNNTDFYSSIVSSAQQLQNGNILICEGRSGEFFEIDSNDNIVWEYINPVSNNDGTISTQGDAPQATNLSFRAIKYPSNYKAFTGRDLTPKKPIENNFNLNSCNTLSSDTVVFEDLKIYPNPVSNLLTVKSNQKIDKLELYSILGKKVKVKEFSNNLNISNLSSGLYLLKIYSGNNSISKKIVKN